MYIFKCYHVSGCTNMYKFSGRKTYSKFCQISTMGCTIKSPIAEKKKLRSSGYNNKLVVLKNSL